MFERMKQWIAGQFENQYGKATPMQSKSAVPDLSGMTKAGAAYVKPAPPVPAPSVETVSTVPMIEAVATGTTPIPPMAVKQSEPVQSAEPGSCSHIFVCAICHQRILPTAEPAPVASGPSPLNEEWNDYERVDLPMRTVEQIRALIPFESPEFRTKRILNDRARYQRIRGM